MQDLSVMMMMTMAMMLQLMDHHCHSCQLHHQFTQQWVLISLSISLSLSVSAFVCLCPTLCTYLSMSAFI